MIKLIGTFGDDNIFECGGGYILQDEDEGGLRLRLLVVEEPACDEPMAEHWTQDYTQFFAVEHQPLGRLYEVYLNEFTDFPSEERIQSMLDSCGYGETIEEVRKQMMDFTAGSGAPHCVFWWEQYAATWGWEALDYEPLTLSYWEMRNVLMCRGVPENEL